MRLLLLCGGAGVGKDTAGQILHERMGAEVLALADPLKEFAEDFFGFERWRLWGPSNGRSLPDERFETRGAWNRAEDLVAGTKGIEWVTGLAGMAQQVDPTVAHVALCRWFYQLREEHEGSRMSARVLLQTLGTEFGRATFGPDIWAEAGILRGLVAVEHDGRPFAVITDGRFANEVARVKARDGVAIRLVDPEATPTTDGHASEHGLDGLLPGVFDATIENPKSEGVEEFERRLLAVVLSLKGMKP